MKSKTRSGLPAGCDVAIVGAGPAGAAAALALRRLAPARSVALIDAGVRQRPMHDEALSQEARACFERLGVWDDFLATDAPLAQGTRAAWGSPGLELHQFLFCPPRQGWRIERPALAAFMVEAARTRGVWVATGTRLVDVDSRADGGWALEIEARGKARTLDVRFVVDASGRQAFLARRLGARKVRFDRLVGAFVTFPGVPPAAADVWVESHDLGFWYAAPQSGDRIVVAFMTDADLARDRGIGDKAVWNELFGASAVGACLEIGGASGEPLLRQPMGPPSIRAMDSHRLDRMIGERWLAVGDAASTIDCLASQGIHQALDLGIRAAAAVVDELAGRRTGLRRYQRVVEQRFEDLLLTRRTIYAREERWPEAAFWARRQDRVRLDSDQLLAFTESLTARERVDALGMHLPGDQLQILCSLCVAPRLVHAVVRAFKERYRASRADEEELDELPGNPPSNHRILLALQYLVDQGLITAE